MSETEVTVRGRLGFDPELQTSATGKRWLRLRIATNRRIRQDEEWVDGPTSWYDVKLWDDFAANVAMSLHKGDAVIVQGPLQIDEYQNAQNVTMKAPVIHARALGPDLRNVVALITRARHTSAETVDVTGMQEVPADVVTDEADLAPGAPHEHVPPEADQDDLVRV